MSCRVNKEFTLSKDFIIFIWLRICVSRPSCIFHSFTSSILKQRKRDFLYVCIRTFLSRSVLFVSYITLFLARKIFKIQIMRVLEDLFWIIIAFSKHFFSFSVKMTNSWWFSIKIFSLLQFGCYCILINMKFLSYLLFKRFFCDKI